MTNTGVSIRVLIYLFDRPFLIIYPDHDFRTLIHQKGSHHLFPASQYQSDVTILGLGAGSRTLRSPASAETFLWQLEGSCVLRLASGRELRLRTDDTLRLGPGQEWLHVPSSESLTMSVVMDPDNKLRPENNEN